MQKLLWLPFRQLAVDVIEGLRVHDARERKQRRIFIGLMIYSLILLVLVGVFANVQLPGPSIPADWIKQFERPIEPLLTGKQWEERRARETVEK